jgi:hypothetical protein
MILQEDAENTENKKPRRSSPRWVTKTEESFPCSLCGLLLQNQVVAGAAGAGVAGAGVAGAGVAGAGVARAEAAETGAAAAGVEAVAATAA